MSLYVCSYIGRKRLYINEEAKLEGFETLIHPKYSYWTLCYILSHSGAKKLLDQKPLQKILPVDEYFPILFNEHPKYVTSNKFVWAPCCYAHTNIYYILIGSFATPKHY